MCGIAGIFRRDGAPIDPARVAKMISLVRFRGPDDEGLSQGAQATLGHTRLSIVDLSPSGRQPMSIDEGKVEIVFNGEIYNFRELRQVLESRGETFGTHTDTEVLLKAYVEFGLEETLRRIRGMFAFAIVDRRSRSIHLARDPLGKKPLYLHWDGQELVFASTALAVAQALHATPEVDVESLDDLIANQYVPGPATILKGVEKLPPATSATFSDVAPAQRRYWAPDFLSTRTLKEDDWVDLTEQTLRTAVRRRLVADVPVGVLLSGGVDSGLVTALIPRDADVRAFSVKTADAALDESDVAAAVARRHHREISVLPVGEDFQDLFPHLVASMGEPLADPSAANVMSIARLAKRSVGVVLTGDGGDEAFGGYSYFWALHHAERLRRLIPTRERGRFAALGARLRGMPGPLRRIGTLLHYATEPLEISSTKTLWVDRSARQGLYSPSLRAATCNHDGGAHLLRALSTQPRTAPLATRAIQTHLATTLVDDYLAKVDIGTMAVGLEARCPFLDLDVIELGASMPDATRFRGGKPKSVLRRLAQRHLPREVWARKKRGFVAPVGRWLRGAWRELVRDLVLGSCVEKRGWFDRAALTKLVDNHDRGADHGYVLWTLMVLELWVRFLRSEAAVPLRVPSTSAGLQTALERPRSSVVGAP